MEDNLGLELPIGSKHYRAYLGPPDKYDLSSANQTWVKITKKN